MKRFYRLCLLLSLVLFAQHSFSQAPLSASLKQIATQLKPVHGSSQSFEQSMTFDAARPYLISASVKETDKKGQATVSEYTFNLADIDPGSINFEAKKELMTLTLKTRSKMAFIGLKENGTQKNNTAQLVLYGTDADNARALVELFRKAVPQADAQFLADIKLPETYETLVKWISSNLDSAPGGSDGLQQSTELDKANPLLMKLVQKRSEKGKSIEQLYQFNAADLSPQRVTLDVDGSVILVKLENKDRFIRSQKNGQWEKNTDVAEVRCLTADKARRMQMAWQKLLPLASKQLDAQRAKYIQYASLNDGLKRVAAAVQPADDGTEHIEQQLTPTCLSTLSRKLSGRKSLGQTYRFYWSDLDGQNARVRSDGNAFVLAVPTKDKGKWITTTQNGQRGSYENTVEIRSNDLETIRFVPALLAKLTSECQKATAASLPAGRMTWVTDKINAVQDPKGQMTYQFQKVDNCNYTYTARQNGGKKSTELRWDINLADLNPLGVKINVSGSELAIDLATNGKDKLIKAYKDGQPTSYANQLSLLINDLEVARPMADIWQQSIAGCRR
ncbi:hypothetical protein GCM10023189_24360 [Nibrella saemangeumensis]|uniref:DUF4412 domain-containing protein n=1 Tax=Nibrella saemangeumensis TaxID=1084526 RepID=A0ABP8MXQ1_9BACT